MATPYEFYLRGSDTYFQATSGYVTTGAADSAPTTIAGPPSTTSGWITISALGGSPEIVNDGEAWQSASGNEYKDSDQRWQLTIRTEPFAFPTDWADWKELNNHVTRRYLYLAVKTYDVTLHASGYCIPVTCEASSEHTYDNGTKSKTLTLRFRAPGEVV